MLPVALFLLTAAAAEAAGPSVPDPISLFRSACMSGTVELEPTALRSETFGHVPRGVLAALGHAINRGPGTKPYPEMPLKRDLPNPIYRVGDHVFLIATTANPVPAARFADSCAVIWRGDSFSAAHDLVLPNAPQIGEMVHNQGVGYVSANDGQQVLTAALFDGWTVLRSSPASAEPPLATLSNGAPQR
jgi:hypothetical protein